MVGESRIEDDVPVEVLLQGEQPADIPVVPFRPAAGEVLQAAVFRIGRGHVRGEFQHPSFLFRRPDIGVRVEKVEYVPACFRLFPEGGVGEPVQPSGRGIHAVLPDGTGRRVHREIVPQQELIEVFGPFPSDVAAAEHQYTFGSLDDAQGQLVPGDVFVPCGQPVLPSAELHEPVDLPGIETENAARFHRQPFGAYEDHVAQVDTYHRLQPVPFDMGQQHAGDILFDGGIPKKGRKAGHAGEAVDLHTGVRYECRYPGGFHPDMQEAEELAGHALPVRVDRIKLVGGVGMGLLPARLVADKETACAVLSEQPFQLPDVLICGCHGRLHFGGYGLSGPSGRFPGSLLKAGRLFLPLFFLRLEGTAFPQEFRTAFGSTHLDGGPVHLPVRGLELDGYL